VDFAGADVDSVNFKGANLKNTKNYDGLDRADFRNADLRGADLSEVELPIEGVQWEGVIYDSTTQFPAGVNPKAVGAVESK
jgi:uncharacterized protein YjbI with pentapeptide repeats